MSEREMKAETRHGSMRREALLLGAALGLAAELLRGEAALPLGPGLPLWLALLALAAGWLGRGRLSSWWPELFVSGALAVSASMALLWRDNPFLQLCLFALLPLAASLMILRAHGLRLGESPVSAHLAALLLVPFRALTGSLPLLAAARLPEPGTAWRQRLAGVLRGLVLAIPLLLIFGALLGSADAAFAELVTRIVSPAAFEHILVTLFWAWVCAGLLAVLVLPQWGPAPRSPRLPLLGFEETAVVLGSLVALFLLFLVLQLPYLFAAPEGEAMRIAGYSLADYARRGFFELLATAALSFVLLLALNGMSPPQRLFRVLASLLAACVLLMLLSACHRLRLYIDAFGLSAARVHALAVMAWLTLSLSALVACLWSARIRAFPSLSLLAGVLVVFALTLLNPAALVARVNLDRATGGAELDGHYLLTLGADAVPRLLAVVDALPEPEACLLADGLLRRWHPDEVPALARQLADWRQWHLAKAQAVARVEEHESRLRDLAAPCRMAPAARVVPRPFRGGVLLGPIDPPAN